MTNAADRDVLFARVPSVDQQVHRLQVRLAWGPKFLVQPYAPYTQIWNRI